VLAPAHWDAREIVVTSLKKMLEGESSPAKGSDCNTGTTANVRNEKI